jgi:soluble lytic murein transglycosylase-like protein
MRAFCLLHCLESAAQHYNVHPAAIERVINANKVKPTGIGIMGIPTSALPVLRNAGFDINNISLDRCTNITAGTWMLGYEHVLRHKVTESCSTTAADHYNVPVSEINRILRANKLHPTGYGPMGIPSQWMPILERVGFNTNQVETNYCINIEAGIWILAVESRSDAPQYTGRVLLPPSQLLKKYAPTFIAAAQHYGISPYLVEAVAAQESGFNPAAVSSAGARGMMQFIPSTAAQYGLTNPFDPMASIWAGAHYIHHLMLEFNGNVSLALAGYNAGGQAVKNAGWQIPHFKQTENYVPSVLAKEAVLVEKSTP